jgi:hypothetical protein
MAKFPNKIFKVTVDVEGVGKFEKRIELDGGDFIEQIKGMRESCKGLEITLAQAILNPSLFEKYMERMEL